jgi:hypothetical protein
VQVLEKLLDCAHEKLTTDEVNNKLLLAKDHREQTSWNVAADEVVRKMWEWAEENLTVVAFKVKLLPQDG